MANIVSQPKRQREEETHLLENGDFQESKRPKTYNQITPVLEEEDVVEDFNPENFSEIFTILQEELSTSDSNFTNQEQENASASGGASSIEKSHPTTRGSEEYAKEEDDEGYESYDNVMKHLLEASDDELGLPNREENGEDEINGGDFDFPFPLNLGWWEFEDEAANYYAMLQSEFFL